MYPMIPYQNSAVSLHQVASDSDTARYNLWLNRNEVIQTLLCTRLYELFIYLRREFKFLPTDLLFPFLPTLAKYFAKRWRSYKSLVLLLSNINENVLLNFSYVSGRRIHEFSGIRLNFQLWLHYVQWTSRKFYLYWYFNGFKIYSK